MVFFMAFQVHGTIKAYQEFENQPTKRMYVGMFTIFSYVIYFGHLINAIVLMRASTQRRKGLTKVHLCISIVLLIVGIILYIYEDYIIYVHVYITFLFVGFNIYKVYSIWVIYRFLQEMVNMGRLNGVVRRLKDSEVEKYLNGDPEFIADNIEEFTEETCASIPFNPDYVITPEALDIYTNEILGKGAFGIVCKGQLKTEDAQDKIVAVKTTKSDADMEHFKMLLLEMKMMAFLGPHENIVNLLGAVTYEIRDRHVWIVVELCEEGSLESFLKRNKHNYVHVVKDDKILNIDDRDLQPSPLIPFASGADDNYKNLRPFTTEDMLVWAYQISKGMAFLSSKKVVHGDLAARNILLTSDLRAKITDFGLSRKMYSYKLYVRHKGIPLPWRYLAMESLSDQKFSTQSDVWSYGVVLWEIFSLGAVPYPGTSWTEDFSDALKRGERLEKPEFCPTEIYEIMKSCWQKDPDHRPTFEMLKISLLEVLARANHREYDSKEQSFSYYT